MKELRIHIKASSSYDVIIYGGAFDDIARLAENVTGKRGAVIVSDDRVFSLYGKRLTDALIGAGYGFVKSFVFPNGEGSKNLDTYSSLISFMAKNGVTRSDCVFSLGGGVVGDLAGFAAATYMRGMKFIQIPTTLLSAVDSSVGGKTAIDTEDGKNLIGAFCQPSLVICDPALLSTLDEDNFSCGMAEVIKYGIISDPELFSILEKTNSISLKQNEELLSEIIQKCLTVKANVVEEDEFDLGKRKILNFGHTAAHAIEKLSGYTIPHGKAVAIGILIITRASMRCGIIKKDDAERIEKLLSKYGLPTKCDHSADEVTDSIKSDKKCDGKNITLVVPTGIGDVKLYDMPMQDAADFLRGGF